MLKQKFLTVVWMGLLGMLLLPQVSAPLRAAQEDDDSDSSMRLQEKETIHKTFNLTAANKILEVDNIFGSIDVVGGPSDQVQLVVNKTISAETKDRMEAAKKEVTLEITDQPDFLKLYVNGPFRCNCDDGRNNCRGHGDDGYTRQNGFSASSAAKY